MRRKHEINSVYETNRDGKVLLLGKNGKQVFVRFMDTDYERWVNIDNLVAGKCKDYSKDRSPPWVPYDEPFISNSGSSGRIIAKKSTKVLVKFDKTGHVAECFMENVRSGKLKDPYEKTFLGVGYLGEYEKTHYWKQAKQLWSNMMKRCYNEKDPKGYYLKGVVVDSRWHCFANFLKDIPDLENFDAWLLGQSSGEVKYNLDKDSIVEGNKVYSKELCKFLTDSENKSLSQKNKSFYKKNG